MYGILSYLVITSDSNCILLIYEIQYNIFPFTLTSDKPTYLNIQSKNHILPQDSCTYADNQLQNKDTYKVYCNYYRKTQAYNLKQIKMKNNKIKIKAYHLWYLYMLLGWYICSISYNHYVNFKMLIGNVIVRIFINRFLYKKNHRLLSYMYNYF